MKNRIQKMHTRVILPFLLLISIFTLPSVVTESKYVWNESINITLTIQAKTSTLIEFSANNWKLNLTNIESSVQEEGVVLSAQEGYILPESFTVQIGAFSFIIYTNGTDNPEGISFDPVTNLLSISESLIKEKQGEVTVVAAAVSNESSNGENNGDTTGDSDGDTAGDTTGDSNGDTTGDTNSNSDGNTVGDAPGVLCENITEDSTKTEHITEYTDVLENET